jgi:hypothetical protein
VSVSPAALRQGQRAPQAEGPKTFSVREFTDLNLAESRLSLDDRELALLENGMFLGGHIVPTPLYGGPAGASLNANSLVKESYGCSLTYGINLAPHPVAIVVFEDGSAYMRDFYIDQPIDTLVAPAGTFGTSPLATSIKVWQDGPVLFLDERAGYCKWDGVAFGVIDNSKLGSQLAVFEGHAWLKTAPRTFTYTAPNSFSDFAAGDGAGSFKITDDSFQGSVTAAVSTVEQLWLLGASAVDALGNVVTSGGLTTFSVTNALTSLGTVFPDSVAGYFRALTFSTGYSIHSLLGVTPQKLSSKIDRLFALLDKLITFGPRVGVQTLNGVTVLVFLFQLTDPMTGATRAELLCYQEGKWFLATTPAVVATPLANPPDPPDSGGAGGASSTGQVVDLVTLTIHATPEVYGVDRAGFMYRIFARVGDAQQGTMTVSTKLFDMGEPTKGHQGIRVGLDLSAPARSAIVPITLSFTTERATATQVYNEGFFPEVDSFLGLRHALLRRDAPIDGQRLGVTLRVPCAYGVTIEAVHLEWTPTDSFDAQAPVVTVWDFTDSNGDIFRFTDTAVVPYDWIGSVS